jgi:hypothetical protein
MSANTAEEAIDSIKPVDPRQESDPEKGHKAADCRSGDEARDAKSDLGRRDSGEKVVVLSFRALQLERIERFQDMLVQQDKDRKSLLEEGKVTGLDMDETLDELLEKYGKHQKTGQTVG